MKIGILTNFQEFNPGYSLTGIVKDQCRMLLRHGHQVHLFVGEVYNPKYDADMPEGITLHKQIPFAHLKDYRSVKELSIDHQTTVEKTREMLSAELKGFDMAWTHDWVFQGWYMPYGLAVQRTTLSIPDVRWLHWIHSIPCINQEWWDIKPYGRRHKLVSPTQTERNRVAEQYKGTHADVRVIPHIKDMRSWYDFDETTCAFIDEFPGVMHADIVQIYPASSDRLDAKNLHRVIQIFGYFKKHGQSVCLVCADQWATATKPKQNEQKMVDIAHAAGLEDHEFIFTSRFQSPKYEIGIPKRMLRELQLCQNQFIFPTTQESFGLVGPEAALSGAMVVINRSLHNQFEVFENMPMNFTFGSYYENFEPDNWDNYLEAVAGVVVQRMRENESILTKTICRQKYNFDTVYKKWYEPIMNESKHWTEGAK